MDLEFWRSLKSTFEEWLGFSGNIGMDIDIIRVSHHITAYLPSQSKSPVFFCLFPYPLLHPSDFKGCGGQQGGARRGVPVDLEEASGRAKFWVMTNGEGRQKVGLEKLYMKLWF